MISLLLKWFADDKAAAMVLASEKLKEAIASGNRLRLEEANKAARSVLPK